MKHTVCPLGPLCPVMKCPRVEDEEKQLRDKNQIGVLLRHIKGQVGLFAPIMCCGVAIIRFPDHLPF